FRHTFGADMVRAGVSLPALMRLMGHSHIHTTMNHPDLQTPAQLQRNPQILRWLKRLAQENPPLVNRTRLAIYIFPNPFPPKSINSSPTSCDGSTTSSQMPSL
ncbi:MAG: site-specific integrase, partial [Deltaproteobacteria bacterium]|nr:site-specific integrase [Deltaproteobacteria bacterium]